MSYEEDRLKKRVSELEPDARAGKVLLNYLSKVSGLSSADVLFSIQHADEAKNELIETQMRQAFMSIKLVCADAFRERDEKRREAERQMELRHQKIVADEAKRKADLVAHDAMNHKIQASNKKVFDDHLKSIVDQYREPVNYNSVPYDDMVILGKICDLGNLQIVRCGFMWNNFMVVGQIPEVVDFSPLYQHLVDQGIGQKLIEVPENLRYSHYMDGYMLHHMRYFGESDRKKYFSNEL